MRRLSVLQHHPAEAPGAIADWARSSGIALDILHPASESPLPDDIDCDGLAVLGGPWCAFADDAPEWLSREKDWLQLRLDAGLPVFAICLGAQLVAERLGARLLRMPRPETGWVAVETFDRDRGAQTTGRERLDVLQWHEDRFELPPGCVRIAANVETNAETNAEANAAPGDDANTDSSPLCPNQGYAGAGGRIVGLQFHAEWTPQIVSALHRAFGDACPLPPADTHQQRYARMHAWLNRRLDRWRHDCVAIRG